MFAVKPHQQGALAEVRPKLMQWKMKVNVQLVKMEQLKKRVSIVQEALQQQWLDLLKKPEETQRKTWADKSMNEAVTAVEIAGNKANKLIEGARANQFAEDFKIVVDEAFQALREAKAMTAKVTEVHEADKAANRSGSFRARVELMKLTSRISSLERKCCMAAEKVEGQARMATKA